MNKNQLPSTIITFIKEHHVLALATTDKDGNSVSCSLFYTFDEDSIYFIFASDEKTEHMHNISKNPMVSASIHLETDIIGTIRGLQIKAKVTRGSKEDIKKYTTRFVYAKLMKNLQVWKMDIISLKFTDNRLGFGKKQIWTKVD